MQPRRWVSDIPRTLAVAAAFAAFATLGAGESGLFDRLDALERGVLAGFGLLFVVLTLACDAELRAAIARAGSLRTRAAKSPGGKRAAT